MGCFQFRAVQTVGSKLLKMIFRPGLVFPASYTTCNTPSTNELTSPEGPIDSCFASKSRVYLNWRLTPISDGRSARTDSSVAMDVDRVVHHSAAVFGVVPADGRSRLRDAARDVNWESKTSGTPMSKPGTGRRHSG